MQNLQVVLKESAGEVSAPVANLPLRLIVQWTVGILVAFALGTWLVWWGAQVQRSLVMEEIRGACRRIMPDTVERCVDTVIIQRGGVRR